MSNCCIGGYRSTARAYKSVRGELCVYVGVFLVYEIGVNTEQQKEVVGWVGVGVVVGGGAYRRQTEGGHPSSS